MRNRRFQGHAGEVKTLMNRKTRSLFTVYEAAAQGMEDGPESKYAAVCQKHSFMVTARTQSLAISAIRGVNVLDWCTPCQCEATGGHKWEPWGQCANCGRTRHDEGLPEAAE